MLKSDGVPHTIQNIQINNGWKTFHEIQPIVGLKVPKRTKHIGTARGMNNTE